MCARHINWNPQVPNVRICRTGYRYVKNLRCRQCRQMRHCDNSRSMNKYMSIQYDDVTRAWRFRSSAISLSVQHLIQINNKINETYKLHITDPLWGEYTGNRGPVKVSISWRHYAYPCCGHIVWNPAPPDVVQEWLTCWVSDKGFTVRLNGQLQRRRFPIVTHLSDQDNTSLLFVWGVALCQYADGSLLKMAIKRKWATGTFQKYLRALASPGL